jgi:hypothetical protein
VAQGLKHEGQEIFHIVHVIPREPVVEIFLVEQVVHEALGLRLVKWLDWFAHLVLLSIAMQKMMKARRRGAMSMQHTTTATP